MSAVARREVQVIHGEHTFVVREMGARPLVQLRGKYDFTDEQQAFDASCEALAATVYHEGEKAFASMDEAGDVPLDLFTKLQSAWAEIHGGSDPNA